MEATVSKGWLTLTAKTTEEAFVLKKLWAWGNGSLRWTPGDDRDAALVMKVKEV